jgi:hypothetical protein
MQEIHNADKHRQKPTNADEKFQDFFIVCQPPSAPIWTNLAFWPYGAFGRVQDRKNGIMKG